MIYYTHCTRPGKKVHYTSKANISTFYITVFHNLVPFCPVTLCCSVMFCSIHPINIIGTNCVDIMVLNPFTSHFVLHLQ